VQCCQSKELQKSYVDLAGCEKKNLRLPKKDGGWALKKASKKRPIVSLKSSHGKICQYLPALQLQF